MLARQRSIFNNSPAQAQKKLYSNHESGLNALKLGKYYDAIQIFHDCISDGKNQGYDREPPSVNESRLSLARTKIFICEYDDALALLNECLKVAIDRYSLESIQVVEVMAKQAECYRLKGSFSQSESLNVQTLTLLNRVRKFEVPRHRSVYADVLTGIAELYFDQNIFDRVFLVMKEIEQIFSSDYSQELTSAIWPNYVNFKAKWFVAQSKYQSASDLLQIRLDVLTKELGSSHPLIANTLTDIAFLRLSELRYNDALEHANAAITMYGNFFPRENLAETRALRVKASALCALGTYSEADTINQKITVLRKRKLGVVHPTVVECVHLQGRIFMAQGALTPAMQQFEACLELLNDFYSTRCSDPATSKQRSKLVASAFLLQGDIYLQSGQSKLAMEAYQHALGISTVAAKSLQIEADADIAHALIGVGACLRVIGHAKKAQAMLGRAGLISVRLFGENSLMSTNSLMVIANILRDKGRFKDAHGLYARCFIIRRRHLPASHHTIAHVLQECSENFRLVGYYEEGFEPLRTSHVQVIRHYGHRSLEAGKSLFIRAKILCDLNYLDDAHKMFQAAVSLMRDGSAFIPRLHDNEVEQMAVGEGVGDRNEIYLSALVAMAECLRLQGPAKHVEAETLLKQALILAKELLDGKHLIVCEILTSLALILLVDQKLKESKAVIELNVIPLLDELVGKSHPRSIYTQGLLALCNKSLSSGQRSDEAQREIDAVLLQLATEYALSGDHPWVRTLGGYKETVQPNRFTSLIRFPDGSESIEKVDVLQTKTLTGNTVDDFARAVNGESFGESTFKTYSISEEKIDEIISGRNSDEKADDKGTEEKDEKKADLDEDSEEEDVETISPMKAALDEALKIFSEPAEPKYTTISPTAQSLSRTSSYAPRTPDRGRQTLGKVFEEKHEVKLPLLRSSPLVTPLMHHASLGELKPKYMSAKLVLGDRGNDTTPLNSTFPGISKRDLSASFTNTTRDDFAPSSTAKFPDFNIRVSGYQASGRVVSADNAMRKSNKAPLTTSTKAHTADGGRPRSNKTEEERPKSNKTDEERPKSTNKMRLILTEEEKRSIAGSGPNISMIARK